LVAAGCPGESGAADSGECCLSPKFGVGTLYKAGFADGPFLKLEEHISGFWIIEAPDLDVALRLAAEGSMACNRRVEVRAFLA